MTAVEARPDAAARPPTPGRLTFNRPPRLRPALPVESFEVPAPPTPVTRPSATLSSGLVIPLIAVMAMGGMFMFGGMAQANMSYMILAGAALALGSALPTAWMFFEDRRRFRVRAREQIEEHGRRLRNAEVELARLREDEQELRDNYDPSPEHLVRRAVAHGRRLWERRLADADFLSLRLGAGLAPSLIQVVHRSDHLRETHDLPPELVRLMREGEHLAAQYHHVPDVPIRFDLRRAGAVGFTGAYARSAPLARAVLCQAAVHHSPDDLRIVGFLNERTLADWAWLKWLPHVRGSSAGDAPAALAWDSATRESMSRWLFEDLSARKRALEDQGPIGGPEVQLPWLLVFVDDFRRMHKDQALRMALADGRRLHVAVLGLAEDVESVPGGCGGVAVLEGRAGRAGLLTYAESAGTSEPVQSVPDAMGALEAEHLARSLAPLVLVDDSAEGQSNDIPTRITFLESLGVASVDQLDMSEQWRPTTRTELLRTPLGPTSGGDLLWLDLKEQSQSGQGPHGLVAGTTGAGKSELLLTFIAGLALRHSPEVINFVLVDYKGGDAFQAVSDLPHTVALITDLDRHLANRALLTMRSEIKRREHRMLELRSAGMTSLADFQLHRNGAAPMPFLVIVVDEFARLKDDLPEFINGLVDVARVGRSLGVHLILATQTPSGTVDDQIQKNSNFGVCLRVRDQTDSKQVIGEPDAALLPGSLPGRGYFRAGLEPVRLFQTARVGAAYHARSTTAALDVESFEPLLTARGPRTLIDGPARGPGDRTEVRALVGHLRTAAQSSGTEATPWPAPLPEVVALVGTGDSELAPPALLAPPPVDEDWSWSTPPRSADWLVAPIGLVDEPSQVAQRPFGLDIGRNCIVYGGAGSGKSSLLRTLASSLALTHSPNDLHLYALDFDARTLSELAGLPHCGEAGVFFPRDTVRIRRLFRMLEHQVQLRREAGVTNLRQQRRSGSDPAWSRFPFIVVLLDNFAAFRETFEEEEDMTRSTESMLADLASLMRDGSAAGIQFVLTAGVSGSVSSTVANAAEVRIALRQTDATDYGMVGRIEQLPERLPPGRGFAAGTPPRELQVALLPDDVESVIGMDIAGLSTASLFAQLRAAAGDVQPPVVQDLPAWLSLDDPRLAGTGGRPSTGSGRAGEAGSLPIVLGLDDERSHPVLIDLKELQHAIVLGPPGAGKTSLLASCVLQLLDVPNLDCYLVMPRPSALSEIAAADNCRATARNVPQLGELLDDLEVLIDERRETLRSEGGGDTLTPMLLVLDDYELLRQDDDFMDIEMRLGRLARRGSNVGLHVLLGGSNVELRDARDDLVRYISQLRVGVLLQPDIEFDGDVFSVRLRRMVEAAPVGRGYLVVRQQQRLFQAATAQDEGDSLAQSVRRRLPP